MNKISFLVFLAVLAVPWSPLNASTVAPVELRAEIAVDMSLLGHGQLTPRRRAELVERLSDPAIALSAEELSHLFYVGGSHNALIDGSHIAAARQDPELIPLMFEGFINSKITHSTFDPDIFERLLRGLQAFPIEEVRARLAGADLTFVVQAAYERLDFEWVQPLATGQQGLELAALGTVQLEAAKAAAHRWLEELLAQGPNGLVRLQTDSGDITFTLFRRIEAQHLAVMLETGSAEEARLALEIAVQRQLATPEVRAALQTRLASAVDGELSALGQRLQSRGPAAQRLYPVVPLDVAPVSSDWVLDIPRRSAVPLWVLLTAALFGWILLCLFPVTFWPGSRKVFFPLAALGVACLLVLGLEGMLAFAGYQPLMDVRPAFNPNRAPAVLFTSEQKEGETYIVNMEGNSRQLAFPAVKPEGVLRVVTLGESSVHGTHYLAEESFSAALERRLDMMLPDRRAEVINAGVGGGLSDEFVHYASQSYILDPDLLVVYFGNNDLADLMRLAAFRAWTPGSVALRFVLDRIRLVRLLSKVVPTRAKERIVAGGSWLDDEGLSDRDMRFLRRLSELNVRVNMERIVRSAAREGIPTLVALQAQNDDMCGSTQESDDSFHSGCFQEALRRVVRRVGADTGVTVVDVPEAVRFHARAGGPAQGDGGEIVRQGAGNDYFYDTCHPTRLGHQLIGEILAPAAAQLLTER